MGGTSPVISPLLRSTVLTVLFSQRNPPHFYSKALLLLLLFRARARALSLSLSLSLSLCSTHLPHVAYRDAVSVKTVAEACARGTCPSPQAAASYWGGGNAGKEKAHTEGLHHKKEKASKR